MAAPLQTFTHDQLACATNKGTRNEGSAPCLSLPSLQRATPHHLTAAASRNTHERSNLKAALTHTARSMYCVYPPAPEPGPGATVRAKPKSQSLTMPLAETSMLLGVKSRWMICGGHNRGRQGTRGQQVMTQDNPGDDGRIVLMHRGWDVMYQCMSCTLLLPRPLATQPMRTLARCR